MKSEIITFNIYFGLKRAIWKGYYPIVNMIFKILKRLIKSKKEIEFPISYNTIKLEVFSFMALSKPEETFKKLGKLSKVLTIDTEKASANIIMKNLTTNSI